MKPRWFMPAAAVGITLLALALIWRQFLSSEPSDPDFPEGLQFLCEEKDCGETFLLTVPELARIARNTGRSSPVPCPSCGLPAAVRASTCPHCDKALPIPDRYAETSFCPNCEERL